MTNEIRMACDRFETGRLATSGAPGRVLQRRARISESRRRATYNPYENIDADPPADMVTL
jgi:hypothetical protein